MYSRAAATHLAIGEGKYALLVRHACALVPQVCLLPTALNPAPLPWHFHLVCGVPELGNRGHGVAV